MANCYVCGNPILDTRQRLRRKVKTGSHERKVYPSGRVVSVQNHYANRVVCIFCTKRIDRERRMRELHDLIIIATAFATLGLAALIIRLFS